MKKKSRTKKEKEALQKKCIIFGISVVSGLLILAILLSVFFSNMNTNDWKMGKKYFFDPWDGASKSQAWKRESEIFAYYEALKLIEEEGITFRYEEGSYFSADLSQVEDVQNKKALSRMLEDYAALRKFEYLEKSKEELISEGRIEGATEDCQNGVLFTVTDVQFNKERTRLHLQYFFYYGHRNGKGAAFFVEKGEDGRWHAEMNGGMIQI